MEHKLINEYSKQNTAAFWITISIGIILLISVVLLIINYTIALI